MMKTASSNQISAMAVPHLSRQQFGLVITSLTPKSRVKPSPIGETLTE